MLQFLFLQPFLSLLINHAADNSPIKHSRDSNGGKKVNPA